MQAAIAMSQRAKVASQRAKDPEKKKDLGQAHNVYQKYINKNKRVRTNMELLIALAMKFWQWSILIAVVIITFLINLLDKKKSSNLQFSYTEMPELKPIAIKTKGKGFLKV